MIRVLVFIVLLFLLAAGFAWLADRPGEVLVHWQGYEIRATLMTAAAALLVLVALLALIGWIVRTIVRAPRRFDEFLGARRRDRGYRALSTGIVAVGAGDARAARRAADDARAWLGEAPLPLLLAAQAAQLAGDSDRARSAFEALAARPDTKILGLHGLFVEARRAGAHDAARHFAEEAAAASPAIGWAGTALFEYQAQAGDWAGALKTLAANASARLVDKAEAARLRATLLAARALALEAGEPGEARAAAVEAHKLDPALVPAATAAARLYVRAGDTRRAAKILEQSWRVMPHPDIAEGYAEVRPGDSALDRLKRMRRLVEIRTNHPEGAMALARAAIDAGAWRAARDALDGLVRAGPTERVCLLMAEIEDGEHGDDGKLRAWLARAIAAPRDPSWVADGHAFDRWSPVSPVTGRVGVYEWRVATETVLPREAIELRAGLDPAEPPEPPPPRVEALAPPPEPVRSEPAPEPDPPAPAAEAPRRHAQEAVVIEPPAAPRAAPEPFVEAEIAEPAERSSAKPPPAAAPAPPAPAPREAAGRNGAGDPLAGLRPPDDPGPEEGDASAPEEPRRRFRLF